MKLEVMRTPHAVVVRPAGRVTIGPDLDRLRDELESLIAGGSAALVLDLHDVTFLDSAALGQIIASRRHAQERGGKLVLAAPRGKVRDLLELTRIGDLVDVFEGTAEAIASFR